MSKSALDEMATNELPRQRLTKLMALERFRNSTLEDLHAGTYPSSQTGDYSDVKVVTPYGEISWQRVASFRDDEMKLLMIDVVDRCYEFLSELLNERSATALTERLKMRDPLPRGLASGQTSMPLTVVDQITSHLRLIICAAGH